MEEKKPVEPKLDLSVNPMDNYYNYLMTYMLMESGESSGGYTLGMGECKNGLYLVALTSTSTSKVVSRIPVINLPEFLWPEQYLVDESAKLKFINDQIPLAIDFAEKKAKINYLTKTLKAIESMGSNPRNPGNLSSFADFIDLLGLLPGGDDDESERDDKDNYN